MSKDTHIAESNTASYGKQTKRQQVEVYLRQRFKFRFNELTGGIEYTPAAQNKWDELSDYKLNSLCRELDAERGLAVPAGSLIEYLRSDFVPTYHPLREYFTTLSTQNGTDTINDLASTVHVEKPELFQLALTRWLVATVANTFESDGCQNQTSLVLTGAQGGFKTTWLNLLCPFALTKYLFCGKIDLQSKDTLILLATKFIINLDDQLRALNRKDDETVKTLISHGNVTVRRPYDKISSYLTRTASFCGSINSNEFLTDPTGSRRFLPFEVEYIEIDRAQKIDIDKVWAEAYTLYKQTDFTYWFTAQDINELFGNNEAFQAVTQEYELLHKYYELVQNDEWANVCLSTTDVLNYLQNRTRIPLSVKRVGEALKRSKGIQKTTRKLDGNKGWFLRERSDEEVRDKEKAHLPVAIPASLVK